MTVNARVVWIMVLEFKERSRHIFSGPRPRQGRHVLAPRDTSDPATLPTLRAGVLYARFTAAQSGAWPERGSGQGPRFARQARPFSLGAAGEHAP